MSFFKSVLSTLTALIVFSVLASLFGVIILAGIIAASSEESVDVKTNSVLSIDLNGRIYERLPDDPFADLLPESSESKIALLETLESIKKAKVDDRIEGIYLRHGTISGGYSSFHEIRTALEDFKESGKFIYSYAEYLSEPNYYIASIADEIYLHPVGDLEFNGINANVTFFKGLFDKLDIEAQIFKVGTYKGAVEPFLRKDLSEANRDQMNSFINDIYDHYLKNVSLSRAISVEELRDISGEMKIREPEDALELNLITAVGYEKEIKDKIRDELGLEADEKINSVNIKSYIESPNDDYSANKIAVIVAEGDIVSGKGTTENIGSEKFAKAIRKARNNERVKAVVIRINSPGGSALASDVLWNEIFLTKKVKPVIASMSDYAASGGYYIAMPCDTIVAQPATITGSIGIFGIIPNLGGFLENKLGITNDAVNTGEFSDLYRVSSPLNTREKAIIQSKVEQGYETFTSKAAKGRNMKIEALKEVASGRVWTGNQAKENGLVDILGSFNDAVEIAANSAKLDQDYMVTYYPTLKTKWEELIGDMAGEMENRMMKSRYGIITPYIEKIKDLQTYEGIQARIPYQLEIQ